MKFSQPKFLAQNWKIPKFLCYVYVHYKISETA